MKIKHLILTFGLLLSICSCKQNTTNAKRVSEPKADARVMPAENQLKEKEKKKQINKENGIDSLRPDKVLKDALHVAKQFISLPNFSKEYETEVDSEFIVTTNLRIGHLFSKTNRHLLMRRIGAGYVYLNIFLIRENNFHQVMFRKEWDITYVKDTISDVNGDGQKDFLVNWYGSSGCCLKNFYNVYLYQPVSGTFAGNYEFINPTFSPKERMIRGVEYGHPGEVGLYKYKWNVLKVDTIEFIYPDVNRKGQFIKTMIAAHRPTEKDGIVLKNVPKEYLNIYGYNWFTDF